MSSLQDEARLMDPDFHTGNPFPVFERLRREAPVFYYEPADIWALTRLEDVRLAGMKSDVFGSHGASFMSDRMAGNESAPVYDEEGQILNWFRTEPALHRLFRQKISPPFSIPSVAKMEEGIREIVRSVLAEIPDGENVDLVQTALTIPLYVITDLLGVPRQDRPLFTRWSEAQIAGFATRQTPEQLAAAADAHREFLDYMTEAQKRRERNPSNDLMSMILNMDVDGKKMTLKSQARIAFGMLVAGHDTTKNSMTGGLLALVEHPDQLEKLKADPNHIITAVDEIVRWITPIIHFTRTLTRDFEIRGQKLREGDCVALLYSAANRDTDAWATADRFDIARKPEPMHVGFSAGAHICLGMHLARLELRIILEEVLSQFESWDVAGKVVRTPSTVTNSFDQAPMIFRRH